jgi:hypothetical protein
MDLSRPIEVPNLPGHILNGTEADRKAVLAMKAIAAKITGIAFGAIDGVPCWDVVVMTACGCDDDPSCKGVIQMRMAFPMEDADLIRDVFDKVFKDPAMMEQLREMHG